MEDQATKLRKMINSRSFDDKKNLSNRKAKVITITSGKGGVGKTNFAVNLAISIKRLGYRVIIMDVDFGLANVEILTGTSVKYTINDCITNGKKLEEIIVDGPYGIKLISGGIGLNEKAIMNGENVKNLLKEMEKVEYITDFIIIDTGAGVSNTVLNFIMASDETILITTPDPTAIMDGYTILKALTICGYKGKLNIVINIVENRKEAYDTYEKLYRASKNFLNQELEFLGYLERSDIVHKAVINQYPFSLSNPNSSISKRINIMALKFIEPSEKIKAREDNSFIKRLMDLLSKKGDFNGR